MNDYPIIDLPGSETWRGGYEWGEALDKKFPGQDAEDFASACYHNSFGPLEQGKQIASLKMLQRGERDGDDWVWRVEVLDPDASFWTGKVYFAEGGCDYTGWDCQSSIRWFGVVAR